MRVALDATPLSLSSGGLRRYVEQLSLALARCFPEDDYLLASDQPLREPPTAPNLRPGGRPQSPLARRWWLAGLNGELARQRSEIFHGTNYEVPWIARRPSVMTIHDLSPWQDPAWHHAAARVRRRTPVLLRLGLATMVITVSRALREDAIRRFRLAPERVVAVPLAPAPSLGPVQPAPGPPYFLFLGTVEPRKNLPLLVQAWREARLAANAELWIAGRAREDAPKLEPEPGLRLLGEVPEAQLSALYSGAVAVVYPSLYEGFGLPVVEALQCGAMVIASRDPAISEVAGDAAVLLDARDGKAWAAAMTKALSDPRWCQGWRDRAAARAAMYTWTETARSTRDVYLEAIRRYSR